MPFDEVGAVMMVLPMGSKSPESFGFCTEPIQIKPNN
jgi:hypothetical protein